MTNTAVLAAVQFAHTHPKEIKHRLEELALLCDTLSIRCVGMFVVPLREIQPRFLIGSGKTEEIIEYAVDQEADYIIFDDDLSPTQQRNWEAKAKRAVCDRRDIILEIFSIHAYTKESRLQVELAQLEHSLPRLKSAWTHLSRQKGGAWGTRGEGETQLEIDRRIALRRISNIKKELEKVTKNRAVRRKKRRSVPVTTGSFVGYTNAGKSSLLNALTGAGVLVQNKLFATLDPTTRKIAFQSGTQVLLTDTVGFIRRLPHTLVDAFHSTLEETIVADFLVHVLDATNPEIQSHFETTVEVLRELQVTDKPILTVFNKIDILSSKERNLLSITYPDSFFVSAVTGEGLEALTRSIQNLVRSRYSCVRLSLPSYRHDLLAYIHREGRVLETEYINHHIEVTAELPERIRGVLQAFIR